MTMVYSAKFKERMVRKMSGPGKKTPWELSKENGVAHTTLSAWLQKAKMGSMEESNKGNKSGRNGGAGHRWTASDKVRIVLEASGLKNENLGAFLRKEGLHEEDLKVLREEVTQAATEGLKPKTRTKVVSEEKKRILKLEKELARKEKALAEAAALLVLQKKVHAFFSAEEEGDTTGNNE